MDGNMKSFFLLEQNISVEFLDECVVEFRLACRDYSDSPPPLKQKKRIAFLLKIYAADEDFYERLLIKS